MERSGSQTTIALNVVTSGMADQYVVVIVHYRRNTARCRHIIAVGQVMAVGGGVDFHDCPGRRRFRMATLYKSITSAELGLRD